MTWFGPWVPVPPYTTAIGFEPSVWGVLAQPDQYRLTCGNDKMILAIYKSVVYSSYCSPRRNVGAPR
jgi:hypothetical protein